MVHRNLCFTWYEFLTVYFQVNNDSKCAECGSSNEEM